MLSITHTTCTWEFSIVTVQILLRAIISAFHLPIFFYTQYFSSYVPWTTKRKSLGDISVESREIRSVDGSSFFIKDHRCIIQSRMHGGSRGESPRNNAACVVECAIAHRQAYFIDQARPVNLYRTASCRDANFIAIRRCISCFIIPCWEFCNVVNRNFGPINANIPIRSIDGREISNCAC